MLEEETLRDALGSQSHEALPITVTLRWSRASSQRSTPPLPWELVCISLPGLALTSQDVEVWAQTLASVCFIVFP